jgi:hypothetical protein
MLNLNASATGGKEFGDVYKVLILDKFCKDILAPLLRINDLRKQGVTLHLSLEADRQPIPDVPAVYFLQPTPANVERVVQDAQAGLYDAMHVNFVSAAPGRYIEQLAAGVVKAGALGRVTRLFDQYMSFVALEPSLFSLNLPACYLDLNDPCAKDSQIEVRGGGGQRGGLARWRWRAAAWQGEVALEGAGGAAAGPGAGAGAPPPCCGRGRHCHRDASGRCCCCGGVGPAPGWRCCARRLCHPPVSAPPLQPAPAPTRPQAAVTAIVDGLFSALVTLGQVPIIRCPAGGAAEHVATLLDARLRDALKSRNNIFSESTPALSASLTRPLLAIFDRNFDLAAMLQVSRAPRSCPEGGGALSTGWKGWAHPLGTAQLAPPCGASSRAAPAPRGCAGGVLHIPAARALQPPATQHSPSPPLSKQLARPVQPGLAGRLPPLRRSSLQPASAMPRRRQRHTHAPFLIPPAMPCHATPTSPPPRPRRSTTGPTSPWCTTCWACG